MLSTILIRRLVRQPSVVQKCGKTRIGGQDMGYASISYSAPHGGIEVTSDTKKTTWSSLLAHSSTTLWISVSRAA